MLSTYWLSICGDSFQASLFFTQHYHVTCLCGCLWLLRCWWSSMSFLPFGRHWCCCHRLFEVSHFGNFVGCFQRGTLQPANRGIQRVYGTCRDPESWVHYPSHGCGCDCELGAPCSSPCFQLGVLRGTRTSVMNFSMLRMSSRAVSWARLSVMWRSTYWWTFCV